MGHLFTKDRGSIFGSGTPGIIGGDTPLKFAKGLVDVYGGVLFSIQEEGGVDILAYNTAATGRNLLIDGDMEAVGVAAWTPGNSATLTKQGSAHGGAQCLRVARNGVNIPSAMQSVCPAGYTYRTVGYARSDGLVRPLIKSATGTLWTGTLDVAWQPFDIEFTQTAGTFIRFGSDAGFGVEWVEYDDVTVVQQAILASSDYDPASTNPLTGTYTGVTLAQEGPDKLLAGYWDGTNDKGNLYTPTFNSFINPVQGCALVAMQVDGLSTWVDGVARYVLNIAADANNYFSLYKSPVNNRFVWEYCAGGILETITKDAITDTDFCLVGASWDTEWTAFWNGLQEGTPQPIAGTWVGNLASTTVCLGAQTTAPVGVWDGRLCLGIILQRVDTALPNHIRRLASLLGV